jgi:hypothetical protein
MSNTRELKRSPLSSDRGRFAIFLSQPLPSSIGSFTIDFEFIANSTNDAVEGADFVVIGSRSVTFAAEEFAKTVEIDPLNDNKYEGTENIRLRLIDPRHSRVALGATAQARIDLHDNEFWAWAPVTGEPNKQVGRGLVAGPVEYQYDMVTVAGSQSVLAIATGQGIEKRYWFGDIEFGVGLTDEIECELEEDGTIIATVSGNGTSRDGRMAAGIDLKTTVDNSGDLEHTVTIDLVLRISVDYAYTTTVSGTLGGGIKNAIVTGSRVLTQTVTGSHSKEHTLSQKYTLKAVVKEAPDPLSQ